MTLGTVSSYSAYIEIIYDMAHLSHCSICVLWYYTCCFVHVLNMYVLYMYMYYTLRRLFVIKSNNDLHTAHILL